MLFKDVLELITVTPATDSEGLPAPVKSYRKVFANAKSVRASEFYQAAAVNLRPAIVFEMMAIDYQAEQVLRFNNREYSIIRTYMTGPDRIEITCQEVG